MPLPGKAWFHVVANARGIWLPGDPRGFHSRRHRLHSTGDYKKPPRPGEHAGLHRRIRANSATPIRFAESARSRIGRAILEKAEQQRHRILALAIDAMHLHVLAELSDDRSKAMRTVGSWKQHASHRVREDLPGRIWAHSCDLKRIEDERYHNAVFAYIMKHRQEGAWVWCYQEKS